MTAAQQGSSAPFDSMAERQRGKDAKKAETKRSSVSDRTKEDRTQLNDAGQREQLNELMPDEILAVDEAEQ